MYISYITWKFMLHNYVQRNGSKVGLKQHAQEMAGKEKAGSRDAGEGKLDWTRKK